jgi:hypothetical protein
MRRIFFIFAAMIALSSLALAYPLCTTQSIQYYETNFNGIANACQIGDKLFYNFNYSSTATGGASTVPASAVTVTADPSNPNEPGIFFTSDWAISSTTPAASQIFLDSTIQFTVSVIGGAALIQDASLSFAGFASSTGQGVADIAETVILNGGTSSTNLEVDTVNGPFTQTVGFTPQSTVRVSKDMILVLASGQTGSATITQFREGFSELPEPLTTALLGSGLLGLGLLRRRR